jgi:hypothetical protein
MSIASSVSLFRSDLGPTQSPTTLFSVKRVVPTVSKLPGNEAENSPAASDEAKNEWSYISTSSCAFMERTEITKSLPSSETVTRKEGKTFCVVIQ